ncbi:hypothetical protein C8Q80DRAFT_876311 [Daedaleopsis nitida]|nr:hypothetical protein C8Q80DRAFT_876311 [Daedaleopsis nitida]
MWPPCSVSQNTDISVTRRVPRQFRDRKWMHAVCGTGAVRWLRRSESVDACAASSTVVGKPWFPRMLTAGYMKQTTTYLATLACRVGRHRPSCGGQSILRLQSASCRDVAVAAMGWESNLIVAIQYVTGGLDASTSASAAYLLDLSTHARPPFCGYWQFAEESGCRRQRGHRASNSGRKAAMRIRITREQRVYRTIAGPASPVRGLGMGSAWRVSRIPTERKLSTGKDEDYPFLHKYRSWACGEYHDAEITRTLG